MKMRISKDQIIIPDEKRKSYLLVFKTRNDKSGFLKEIGFSLDNWQDLSLEITELAISNEIIFQKSSNFGSLYSISGKLRGMAPVTIWFHLEPSNKFRFVNLFPEK